MLINDIFTCYSGNIPKFWYVDNDGDLVHEKNKAAILFNSEFYYVHILSACEANNVCVYVCFVCVCVYVRACVCMCTLCVSILVHLFICWCTASSINTSSS